MPRERVKQIKFYLSDEEYELLKEKVQQSKLKQGEYILKCTLDKKIVVIEDIKELMTQVKKIGNNVNQLTKAVHEGIAVDTGDSLEEIREDLKLLLKEIIRALKKV